MLIANIAYPKQIKVQILDVWSDAGRTWAKIRALECQPFTALRDGQPYDSDWTVVDNKRLHDQVLLYASYGPGRPPRRESARRLEEKLLQEKLLGGGYERQQPA